MTRRLFTLLLLAVFGLGLLAGPHPCKAAQQERESAQPSCHGAGHPSESPEARADASPDEHGQSCCETLCQHACHMTAIAEAQPILIAIAPLSQAVAEVSGSEALRLAHPIDHIPLG